MSEQVKKPKGIEEGPPIFIESLMDIRDWIDRLHEYPNTSHEKMPRGLEHFKENLMKWRWRMGGYLTTQEIKHINTELETLIKTKVLLNE